MKPLDEFPKHEGFIKYKDSLNTRFGGTNNIVVLNGGVWKKHRMVSYLERFLSNSICLVELNSPILIDRKSSIP